MTKSALNLKRTGQPSQASRAYLLQLQDRMISLQVAIDEFDEFSVSALTAFDIELDIDATKQAISRLAEMPECAGRRQKILDFLNKTMNEKQFSDSLVGSRQRRPTGARQGGRSSKY